MILYPPSNPVAFEIFNLQIRWYGLIIAFSIVIGLIFCIHLIQKFISKNDINIFLDFSPLLIIFAILGARLFYVISNWSFYRVNLSEIILINHGGLSIFGAIFAGLIFILLYSYCNV